MSNERNACRSVWQFPANTSMDESRVDPRGAPSSQGVLSRLARNRALFWQGEPQPQDIEVIEGCIRAVRLQRDGGRQILTFFWPGDVVLASHRRQQCYTAETVTTCLLRISKPSVTLQEGYVGADEQVFDQTLELLQAISQRGALARVAWFLLRMRDHLPKATRFDDALEFTVPRKDIADHIGTSLETVCRGLTELKERRVIELPNRKTIRFKQPAELKRIARGDATFDRRSIAPGIGAPALAAMGNAIDAGRVQRTPPPPFYAEARS